jgi:hypothetical protein
VFSALVVPVVLVVGGGGGVGGCHEIQVMHGNVIDASSHIFSFIYVYAIELMSVILSERL